MKRLLHVSAETDILPIVVVTVNKMKPFAHAPVPVNTWEPLPGAVASGFFYVRFTRNRLVVGDPYGRARG